MAMINFFGLLFTAICMTSISANSVKYPINSYRHLRHKRQSGAGYFFSQNISFGLEPSPPGTEFGPWGTWTDSSDCSRTCGGGIAFQDRICLNVRTDGRHSCVGSSRRYYSCNIQDCPEGSKDFRSEQCSRFNSVPYENKHFSWLPYYKGQNPCELNCMPRGAGFYTRLARKVIDGTRCHDDGSLDVCVDGVCMPVGCDMILGSTTKEDECRECGGDGTSCQIVRGVFDKDNFEVGYNDILLIPAGATSISVKEQRPSNNYLAIRNAQGKFYLNGDWRIEFPRDLKIAGTLFHYERKPHGFLAPESLLARGPTTEPIFIVLLYQATNLGVSYEYSIPIGVNTVKPDSYIWTFGDYEECSQTCGGGLQYRPVRCIRNSDRDIVAEDLCDPSSKPPVNHSCNVQPCPARWQIGEWSNCSHPCGGGTQFRLVFCHQLKDGNSVVLASEDLCDEPKPLFMRACNEGSECPEWVMEPWTDCDETCGQGKRTRTVKCISKESNETTDHSSCLEATKPAEEEKCTNGPCEGVEWILSEWSGCEGLCSPRMESREAHCANEDGTVFENEACDPARLPELSRSCPISAMCEPMWHASQWTECSVNCGNGVQTRVVFCGVWENNSVIKIDESKCTEEKKFEDVQNCSSNACDAVWFIGPWERCPVPCGGGERSRKVLCFHENIVVEDTNCDAAEKPFETEPCNMKSCDGDEMIPFDGCKDHEFGCCPDSEIPAGPNFQGCPKLNITDNSTCEEAEFGCCLDEFTLAMGPFKKGCPSMQSCNSTKHGCCPDQTTAASGPDFAGCVVASNCSNTTYGCCPDGITASEDEDMKGCNMPDVLPGELFESSGENCNETEYGCCPDGLIPAIGPDNEGCDEMIMVTVNCSDTEFGCCEDNITIAKGPFLDGCGEIGSGDDGLLENCTETGTCPEMVDCSNTTFGCCPDNSTVAMGPENEGCPVPCTETEFGCCSDNVTAALGPDNEGCDMMNVTGNCSESEFGCCPDNITVALGLDNEGCDAVNMTGNCSESEFGCCPDNITVAMGLDNEGCDAVNMTGNCSESEFGCCPDNFTLAMGLDNEGCDAVNMTGNCSESEFGCCLDNEGCLDTMTNCSNTTYGCCPDNVTIATGPDDEGCVDDIIEEACNITVILDECENETDCNVTTEFKACPTNISDTLLTTAMSTVVTETEEPAECENTLFGCCPDMKTLALGDNLEGCCFGLKFGCCPDNRSAALGPQFRGCNCNTYPYGCCPDGLTPAQGYRYHGCRCEHFRYGCCPDGQVPASGPNFEGCKCEEMRFGCCSDGITPMTGPNGEGCGCVSSRYGCCPDGKTPAVSADLTGCPCDTLPYGCCPDGRTPARTSDLRDCPCDKQRFGCCLDGRTPARGPNYEGCPCESTRFGCCFDGRTMAHGPDFAGCPCEATQYGCCADGLTRARGPAKEGCPKIQPPAKKISSEVCSLPKEVGPCSNYTVKWFFNVAYGGCSRFWFGGCPGNGNVFATQEECEETCVTPEGADACLLPKVVGPCEGKYPSYYYDIGSKVCESFMYSGCLGNNNRFTNKELCEQTCIMQKPMDSTEVCELPKDEGPCDETAIKWYFNKNLMRCEQFYYGGCRGNMNRFETRTQCEEACIPQTMMEKDICRQPQDRGSCQNFHERWFYDAELSQCSRFYYGGCEGNENNFRSHFDCQKQCGKDASVTVSPMDEFKIEFCFLEKDVGPCSSSEIQFFYDRQDGICKEFYYSGCEGNGNRFKSKRDCEAACENAQDICRLPVVKGTCSGSFNQFYYDHSSDECFEFVFTGCKGNANRFNNKKDCLLQCARNIDLTTTTTTETPLPDDLCALPQDPGPCQNFLRVYYYDADEDNCKSFVYGGCGGNENRFEQRSTCEQTCLQRISKVTPPISSPDSTRVSNEDVCRLPVDSGPCTEAQKRWFYDAQSQTCLPFVYKGCGGNKNRFKSADICNRFCSGIKASPSEDEEIPVIPLTPTVITTTVAPEVPVACPSSNCYTIQCPFGIEETFDQRGCSTCRCSNPCEAQSCPPGSRCAIDIIQTGQGGTRTEPVCRKMRKFGECPPPPSHLVNTYSSSRECTDRCRDDADCRSDHKCCNNGCANVCMQPEGIQVPATQPEPASILPGPNVTRGRVGEPSELPCRAIGSPKPTVTWWRESTMLPLSSSRYEQLSTYSLYIKTVRYDDQGDYSCQAHNGIGPGASFTVTLLVEVFGPQNDYSQRANNPPHNPQEHHPNPRKHPMIPTVNHDLPTYDTNNPIRRPYQDNVPLSASISLTNSAPKAGSSVHIDCSIQGPETGLEVSWHFEGSEIKSSSRKEILSNHTLFMRRVETSDSGEYTCIAKHEHSVASSSITLHVEADSSDDPTCFDSPQFSNCELIVKAKYCNNKYYKKFCCGSCKRAGQLQQ